MASAAVADVPSWWLGSVGMRGCPLVGLKAKSRHRRRLWGWWWVRYGVDGGVGGAPAGFEIPCLVEGNESV